MRTIAVINQKGGVGKTTTSVSLAAALVERGRSVLCVDLDPQAHLSINFGIEPGDDAPSCYDLLAGEATLEQVTRETQQGVAVVPSSVDLAAAEVELGGRDDRQLLLANALAPLTETSDGEPLYDVVILDCPPSLGVLTVNALAAATEVLIPMQAHFLSLQGMAKLLETVQLVRERINDRLLVTGIVLTMYDAQTKLTGEVVGELRRFLDSARETPVPWCDAVLFETTIRRNIKLAESPSFGETILVYEPGSNGATDYRKLAEELERINPHEIEAELQRGLPSPDELENDGDEADVETEAAPEPQVNPALDAGKLAAARARERVDLPGADAQVEPASGREPS